MLDIIYFSIRDYLGFAMLNYCIDIDKEEFKFFLQTSGAQVAGGMRNMYTLPNWMEDPSHYQPGGEVDLKGVGP